MSTQIDNEIGSTASRPEQPSPEDFDLTPERVSILREPVSANKILENRWFWGGHAVATLISLIRESRM
jgi:hypothetical protein